MKNKTLITVLVGTILIIIILAGFFFYSSQNTNEAMMQIDQKAGNSIQQSGSSAENEKMELNKESSSTGSSMAKNDSNDQMSDTKLQSTRYSEFDQVTFDKYSQNKKVLFFYASWCPTCRPADSDFEKNKNNIPDDITVIRVNYNDPDTDDAEKALASKYGVTYQHTYVQIDSQGKQIAKWNGGGLNELLANIK